MKHLGTVKETKGNKRIMQTGKSLRMKSLRLEKCMNVNSTS